MPNTPKKPKPMQLPAKKGDPPHPQHPQDDPEPEPSPVDQPAHGDPGRTPHREEPV